MVDAADDAGGKPASVIDVARVAGVSQQTVSRVAHGASNVAEGTRKRVLDAMAQLDYTPNVAARALRAGRFHTVGVIARHLDHTGESSTLEAVARAAQAADYTVSLIDLASDTEGGLADATQRLSHQSVDALIIIRAGLEDPSRLRLPGGVPVVASDPVFRGLCTTVEANDAAGAAAAATLIAGLGHSRVQLIGGPDGSAAADERVRTWAAVLGDRVAGPVLHGDWSARSGARIGATIADDTTAVLCANDEMAAGVIAALAERGRSVPGDVSVVGFDDIPLAPFIGPGLTTVKQDFDAIGRALVEAALEPSPSPRVQLVEAELVVRRSAAAPRA